MHQRDDAKEAEAGGSALLARCSSFKQGDRVMVMGRDAEGAKTYRTATIATVRGNAAPPGRDLRHADDVPLLFTLLLCVCFEMDASDEMRRFDFAYLICLVLLVSMCACRTE